jgi:plasmid maintenance system antidote protein VapI
MDERNYRDEHAIFSENNEITAERALRLAITFDEEPEVRRATREHQTDTIDALPREDKLRAVLHKEPRQAHIP